MKDLAAGNWDKQKPLNFRFVKEFARMQKAFAIMETNLKLHTTKLDTLVQQRTAQLEKALKEAERATKFKSNFLANMSHEIRTPLHGILSLINFLLETKLTDEQRDWCSDIRSSTLALTRVLNDILDLSKVEAGKMLLECIEFDILSTAEELIGVFYGIIVESKNEEPLDILLQFDSRLPKKVLGDPTRVRQILSNLLSNAVKFTNHGMILVKIAPLDKLPPTGYKVPGGGGNMQLVGFSIEVTDTGIGINEDQTKTMFAEYTQADLSTTRKYGGTGLGLAIIKNLVEMLGGHISVISELNKGSTFQAYFFFGS